METLNYIQALMGAYALDLSRIDTENGRTRQTLWGGRTDANPKLSLNDT